MAGMTLAALLALILSLGATGGPDAAKKKQKAYDQYLQDNTVTFDELQTLHSMKSNHNETLVLDARTGKRPSTSEMFVRTDALRAAPFGFTRSSYGIGTDCPKWLCGENHNETLVRDTTFTESRGKGADCCSDRPVKITLRVTPWSIYYCPGWICGSNHNETLLRDVRPAEPAARWSNWFTGGQSFAASEIILLFSTLTVRDRCDEYVCGTNHNETLLRDAR
jgi:hypothetical protein